MQAIRAARFVGIAVLMCVSAGLATPALAAAADLYAAPAAAGSGDCSSPADACTIETAVTNANASSITDSVRIRLAGGDYLLSAPTPTALVVTFEGPSLTFEAGSGTPTLSGTETVRVLSIGATSNVTIDGLTITSGTAASPGGAILNDGTLTVRNSTVSNSTAGNGGGISSSVNSTLVVEDSTFSQNSATGVGGGAIIGFGAVTVTRSTLTDNHAPVNGGAINVQPGGTVTVSRSTIVGNTSGSLGGAFSNLGKIDVQGSTISGNTATSGAAIATGNPDVSFTSSIIAAQAAGDACNPVDTIVDGGYNLDTDGTCISADTPAVGSHNGTTAYGSSTYAEVLDAYLGDAPANNGGPTSTLALLNTPDPPTTLANPAFDIVPPSFNHPVAVDGLLGSCSVSDQRGVLAAVGANCGIGAYLLQATTTALTNSAALVGPRVTYTAAVAPAPDGGTVSFNDGADGPATAWCAAREVVSGVASCTVSYPNLGDHQVTATYSGDGAMDNFAGSTSTTQSVHISAPPAPGPVATPPDRTPPTTTLRRIVKVKQPLTLRGTATDAGPIRRVRVSVARHVADKLCRFLQDDRKFSKPRDCAKTSYLDATGTSSWSLKLPILLRGRYTIWTRGIDAAGNIELKNRGRNLLVVRIPNTRGAKASTLATLAAIR